jgi:hypothetical protein
LSQNLSAEIEKFIKWIPEELSSASLRLMAESASELDDSVTQFMLALRPGASRVRGLECFRFILKQKQNCAISLLLPEWNILGRPL